MKPCEHEMILASAGAGKTHALTNRYVRLLAAGAAPERIVALTFTRKAAGEFFEQILAKLAAAAADADRAAELGAAIAAPQLGAEDFTRLLRAVVEAMPRLCLGTLDGFFARVVRSFPFELGLEGDFQVLEEGPALRERRRVLRRMFTAAVRPEPAQREFIEAFKRATFGVEEKRLSRVLDGFIDAHAGTLLDAPMSAQWGGTARIWPGGCRWLEAAEWRGMAALAFQAELAAEKLDGRQRARFDDFFAALAQWAPGADLPEPVKYILKNAFAGWPEMREITVDRRKVSLSPRTRAALRQLAESLVGADLGRRLEMTQGLFAVLGGYERNYHDVVRRAGRLTFADVLRLLLPQVGAPVLSGRASFGADEGARLGIDWRLDGEFDHWLLDEFQDTSFAQWSVLRNLIDEAVQDPERRRSFFYVGDVKQAIFSWRGGDTRLFREIFDHYNRERPGAIAEGPPLDVSWRSGPDLIAMVNRVFGEPAAWGDLLPEVVVRRWSREWREHTSAWPALTGCAESRVAADEAGRFAEVLRRLREIDPSRRGLEVAVLTRTNEAAAAIVEYLRREGGIAAVAEDDRRIAVDNPLAVALLALLRAAAHPGDSLAQQHLNMTPLGTLISAEGLGAADALTRSVLEDIHATGFAGVLERWARKLRPELAGDAFSLERARMLISAAAEFDASGSRDVAEFLEFAASYTRRETDSPAAVRVMTIHKAKGLGFDVVILPDLEGKSLHERREGLGVRRAADRSVEWILDLPPRIFAERDPVLGDLLAQEEADAAYENLCLLYVAMTRAKRGMYVITEPVAASSTARSLPRLLKLALGDLWTKGDPDWFKAVVPAKPKSVRLDIQPLRITPPPRLPRRVSRTPSGLDAGVIGGAQLFALERGQAADFGHSVHALFAEVEWGTTAEWQDRATAWAGCGEAGEEVLACLRAPELARVWARADGAEVWRERPFEVVLDGTWITGVFDRVVIERDSAGRPVCARVIDFKTDRVETEADVSAAVARHAAQLNLYRRVVAVLGGVPVSNVTCELVLTRLRRTAVVPAA